MLKSFLFTIFGCALCMFGYAQDFEGRSMSLANDSLWSHGSFDFNKSLKEQLLSLDSIIIIAIENNPQVQFEEALVERSEHNVENTKRLWLNNIYGSAGYNGGNQSIILNQTEAINESSNITNGYRWGVNVRIPLYELFGRKSQVKMMQAEFEASHKQYEVRALEVQQQVIKAYFDLINSQELVRTRLRDYQTQASNLELARIELMKGNLEMSEFARFSNVATNSESTFLNAKQQFYTAFYVFETVVGVEITLLKR